jgi:hypothetical protein
VDAGEDVAPPGGERGRSRGLFGWEEGEDVAEHAVSEIAQAVVASTTDLDVTHRGRLEPLLMNSNPKSTGESARDARRVLFVYHYRHCLPKYVRFGVSRTLLGN